MGSSARQENNSDNLYWLDDRKSRGTAAPTMPHSGTRRGASTSKGGIKCQFWITATNTVASFYCTLKEAASENWYLIPLSDPHACPLFHSAKWVSYFGAVFGWLAEGEAKAVAGQRQSQPSRLRSSVASSSHTLFYTHSLFYWLKHSAYRWIDPGSRRQRPLRPLGLSILSILSSLSGHMTARAQSHLSWKGQPQKDILTWKSLTHASVFFFLASVASRSIFSVISAGTHGVCVILLPSALFSTVCAQLYAHFLLVYLLSWAFFTVSMHKFTHQSTLLLIFNWNLTYTSIVSLFSTFHRACQSTHHLLEKCVFLT